MPEKPIKYMILSRKALFCAVPFAQLATTCRIAAHHERSPPMIRTSLTTGLILLCAANLAFGQTREDLRYDGKPFAYWETFPRTELKAERRIEALRAMAAFGSRGYAKEATAALVEML